MFRWMFHILNRKKRHYTANLQKICLVFKKEISVLFKMAFSLSNFPFKNILQITNLTLLSFSQFRRQFLISSDGK